MACKKFIIKKKEKKNERNEQNRNCGLSFASRPAFLSKILFGARLGDDAYKYAQQY